MTGADDRFFDDDAYRWLSDRLAAEPRPELPDTVRAQFDATIAEESRKRVAEPVAEPPSGRTHWWLLAGTAAAVVVLAGVVALPRMGSDTTAPSTPAAVPEAASSASGCEVPGTPGADLQPVLSASGTTYTQDHLADQVRVLRARDCGRSTADDEDPSDSATAAISACVVSVAAGQPVLAVDQGWYEDRQAVVALIRTPLLRAFVLDCDTTPTQVLVDVPLP